MFRGGQALGGLPQGRTRGSLADEPSATSLTLEKQLYFYVMNIEVLVDDVCQKGFATKEYFSKYSFLGFYGGGLQ